jgi:hypothetical protein
LENKQVLQQIIDIFPCIEKYVEAVKANPPQSSNFVKVKNALKDESLNAKLHFLLSICTELHDFLESFQSEKPMFPFLYNELFSILRNICPRFIENTYVNDATNATLLSLDLKDGSKLKALAKIDVGYGASESLKSRKVKLTDSLTFKKDCQKFCSALFAIIRSKCSLKNKIVRGASCLSPHVMSHETLRVTRINIMLPEMIKFKQISPANADIVKRNYLEFCSSPHTVSKCATFDWRIDRLDKFIFDLLDNGNFHFPNNIFTDFVKKILLLFHGNADVERGFSTV